MSDETLRPIPTTTDEQGTPVALTRMSPTRNRQRAQCVAPPGTTVPIVFVPGVMGSNLKAKKKIDIFNGQDSIDEGESVWNLDGPLTAGNPFEQINPFKLFQESKDNWWGKEGQYRQQVLQHAKLIVDNSGKIAHHSWPMGTGAYCKRQKVLYVTPRSYLGLDEAQKRGWGSVGWYYYGDFLDWLQQQLNPKHLDLNWRVDHFVQRILALEGTTPEGARIEPGKLSQHQVKKLLDIQFPVYAIGYNWLQSAMDSGKDLMTGQGTGEGRVLGIDEIIAREDEKAGQSCKQVIVVTHSMGGLVGRAAALKHDDDDKILGMIHGVQPIDGAAKFYKALAAGFGGIEGPALGETAKESTPEIAYNPGPLELAPNQKYNGGKPWLFVKDQKGNQLALPQDGDPYEEIYMDTKNVWRAVNPEWLDLANRMDSPTVAYKETVKVARGFHNLEYGGIAGQLHSQTYAHWGDDSDYASYGEVTWTVEAGDFEIKYADRGGLADSQKSGGYPVTVWVKKPQPEAFKPSEWSFNQDVSADGRERDAIDAKSNLYRMTISTPEADGDGTVPAKASAGQIAKYPGCRIACALKGFDHQGDFDNNQVRNVVLDAIVRLVEPVDVNQ